MKKDHWLVHPQFWPYLGRFICVLVSNSFWCSIPGHDLEITYLETITRTACKKLSKKVAQKRRVITVWDLQAKVTSQTETKVEKARKALD